MIQMKMLISATAILLTSQSYAFTGGVVGNGGNPNEIKFKAVATNIEDWIASGNADQIQLPQSIHLADYKTRMLAKLRKYEIHFTKDVILIGGAEKTCKNYIDAHAKNIVLCNGPEFSRFYGDDIGDIYRLIHHEFAGLAGLEPSNGQESDYTISSQLTGFLELELVKRLPVHPMPKPNESWMPAVGWRSVSRPTQPSQMIPFTLQATSPSSSDEATADQPFGSIATLIDYGVRLTVTNRALGLNLELQTSNGATVRVSNRVTEFEFTGERIPTILPVEEIEYDCTLSNTGESIRVAMGSAISVFPSQSNLSRAAGQLVIKSTPAAIFFERIIGGNAISADGPSIATLRMYRGNSWIQVKFGATRQLPELSLTCETHQANFDH